MRYIYNYNTANDIINSLGPRMHICVNALLTRNVLCNGKKMENIAYKYNGKPKDITLAAIMSVVCSRPIYSMNTGHQANSICEWCYS